MDFDVPCDIYSLLAFSSFLQPVFTVQYLAVQDHCNYNCLVCKGIWKAFARVKSHFRWQNINICKHADLSNITFPMPMFTYKTTADFAIHRHCKCKCSTEIGPTCQNLRTFTFAMFMFAKMTPTLEANPHISNAAERQTGIIAMILHVPKGNVRITL
jgi:muconolactone delta-isomerase